MPEDIDVLAAQIRSGGLGVDLTRARYAVYYTPPFLGDYDQSKARIHRPEQDRPVSYYHLVCERTVDERAYRALQEQKDVIEEILAVFKRGGKNP